MSTPFEAIVKEIRELYLADAIPWIIGYSGGKDSTACLQLVWTAITSLPQEQRSKPVHVISTDTLVENPVIAAWVTASLPSARTEVSLVHRPSQDQCLNTVYPGVVGK